MAVVHIILDFGKHFTFCVPIRHSNLVSECRDLIRATRLTYSRVNLFPCRTTAMINEWPTDLKKRGLQRHSDFENRYSVKMAHTWLLFVHVNDHCPKPLTTENYTVSSNTDNINNFYFIFFNIINKKSC